MQDFVALAEATGDGPPLTAHDIAAIERNHDLTIPHALAELYLRGNGGRLNANWVESETAVAPGEPEPGLNCPIEYLLPLTGLERNVFSVRAEVMQLRNDVGRRFPFAERGRAYTYWFDGDSGEVFRLKPKRIDLAVGRWLHYAPDMSVFLAGLNRINFVPGD